MSRLRKTMIASTKTILIFLIVHSIAFGQQVTISLISNMSNLPHPYVMRNWREVSWEYDSLVFNMSATGRYLPLVMISSNSSNYPGQAHFGLYTVVGPTASTGTGEAINCIPAVVGATLSGIDKSSQFGRNWAQMCQEWFNRSNGQNVYMNGAGDETNDDFWYETMPNVFFYELNYLYPHLSNFDSQFVSVANQFTRVVSAMGGGTTPWQLPNINHEGFDFIKMTPVDVSSNGTSWREPEAAGAIAWILYNAYTVTGNPRYRIGAELSMEALNSFTNNPAYELQLSYGAYIGARMNAELGTSYNVEKIVDWLFTNSTERPWGTITGNWGGYDVDGLVGETDYPHGYAFAMNTFEQIGCLVPLVRYDPRFATAIGKWVLNASNAARLFYPGFLPSSNQDSSYNWSAEYDSSSVIAHEAVHQSDPDNMSISPFASGDAIDGGWGLTTLALYGSSHVGILGGIIDTTNIPGILRLDLLKTDYYHRPAYPSFLYYNPDSVTEQVAIDVGSGTHDLYDAVSKSILLSGVTGQTSFDMQPNSAIVAVILPAGGTITYQYDRMLVNGVVVDFHSGNVVADHPPRIKALAPDPATIALRDTSNLYCTADDPDGDQLTYNWSTSGGTFTGSGPSLKWAAPDTTGIYIIKCTVDDGHGLQDTSSTVITVLQRLNSNPVIMGLAGNPRIMDIGSVLQITCHAFDPDRDSLDYHWTAAAGSVSGGDSIASWTAPSSPGYYYVSCRVTDPYGGVAVDSEGILVQDFSRQQTGHTIADFPFDNGKGTDISGNGNNGVIFSATAGSDRFGSPNGSLSFDGTTSYVEVANNTGLNFRNAITVDFWMRPAQIFSREEYPVSHNKWNRWKVSISNGHLRWSITTSSGVHDLDSDSPIVADSLYFVTVEYDGSGMEIFLNGNLDAYASWSGQLATTTVDLMIGAAYPGDFSVNYCGTLDDIEIMDYAIAYNQIENLYVTDVKEHGGPGLPTSFALLQNYPNPFNPATTIVYEIPKASRVTITVFDVLGRQTDLLLDGYQQAGRYAIDFKPLRHASGVYFYVLRAGGFAAVRSMVYLK